MASRTENLARLRERVTKRLPALAKANLKVANEKSADEFVSLVRRAIPRGEGEGPHLIDTLAKADAAGSETGVQVSIGSAAAPYPLHLEGGHRAADGTHVPAKPGWNPAKALMKKRAKGRAARAVNAAMKAAAKGGS